MQETPRCKVCGETSEHLGSKRGNLKREDFHLYRCVACRYGFVGNPWTDYAAIYSDAYYAGQGADPLVDYAFELEHPESTVRYYEWRGITRVIESLMPIHAATEWLDFGCGNGGLVRWVGSQGIARVSGFEEGSIARKGAAYGAPVMDRDDLERMGGRFDIVTAIEVLEHVEDPLDVLKQIRRLMKPGGLFFFTTGNALPSRDRLLEWPYFIPEIHISLFEPSALETALRRSGFRPDFRGYLPGFEDIIRFKILKNLKVQRRSVWEKGLPWKALSRLADTRYKISAHPVAWAS
jgi:SAM-dependent methyltransferase